MVTFKPGDCTENKLLGITSEIISIPEDGSGFIIETRIQPHKTPALTGHLHKTWTETFEILSGKASYRLDGKTLTAQAGDKLVFPPNVFHTHPWNTGDELLRYRQSDQFQHRNIEAARDIFRVFSTFYGLANDGKTLKDGTPSNPLQLATSMNLLMQNGSYIEGLPTGAQRIIFGGLAAVASGLGYQAWYEKYITPQP